MVRTKAVAFALLLGLWLRPALAQDYVMDAVTALEQSPVYIAPGLTYADDGTAAELRKNLTRKDNIILVMLPASATDELGMSPLEIAVSLSDALGYQPIIGLAVGDEVVGYAASLPDNVAADRMEKSSEISNGSPKNALIGFVNYMHVWLSQNPQSKQTPTPVPTAIPTPTDSQETADEDGGIPWLVPTGLMLTAAVIGGAIQFRRRQLHVVPTVVSELLDHIATQQGQINNHSLQATLSTLPEYVERYFRYCSKDRKSDAITFKDDLETVIRIMNTYIDAQQNPQYHNDYEGVMERSRQGVNDFSNHVLQSIKLGTEAELKNFEWDVTILQEKSRLAADPHGLEAFERELQG